MKKVMLFIVSMLFAVSASAATLTWTQDNPNYNYSGPGGEIGATETYSVNGEGAHTDILHFTSDVNVNATSFVTETLDSQFNINSITLNGVAFVQSVLGPISIWELNNIALVSGFLNTFAINIGSVVGAGQLNVQVSAVPVPAALFLFAPALLGFLGLRRRKATTALVA